MAQGWSAALRWGAQASPEGPNDREAHQRAMVTQELFLNGQCLELWG